MDDISATRKLTTSETTKLRSLLKSKLNLANADDKQQAEEDASDLLDYTFAMIANGKNVKYVTDELKVRTIFYLYLSYFHNLNLLLSLIITITIYNYRVWKWMFVMMHTQIC